MDLCGNYFKKEIIEDNKKIELEDYCYELLKINNKSEIFDKVDMTIFIYDIKDTELINYLTESKLNKLKKMYQENETYIVGSFLTDVLLSSIDNIYLRNQLQFNKLNIIQSILQNEVKERILFDGTTIYFTIKWYNLYRDNKLEKCLLMNIDNFVNNISYQYYLIYNYKIKNTLDNVNKLNHKYNQYDIELIDNEYVLRYFFKHMDLSDDFHIRYIIYLFILKPTIILDKYNNKNIINILLDEYELKKEYIDNYNKIIAYIHTMNPLIFTSKMIQYTKNNYEMHLMMHYII